MGNILLYIISLIFGACCAFLMLVAKVFGLTYTEASVFVNIYAQYGILILSSLSIVFVATKKIIRGCNKTRILVLLSSIIYTIPYVGLGVFIYNRYGVHDCDMAFELCKQDLWALGKHINVTSTLPYYCEGWTEYFIVNIFIFIVLYLLLLFINWKIRQLIMRYA